MKFNARNLQSTLVFRILLEAARIFYAARFLLEAVGAKWESQQRERPLRSKLKRLSGKNKLVNLERMIMAISEIGHVFTFSLDNNSDVLMLIEIIFD